MTSYILAFAAVGGEHQYLDTSVYYDKDKAEQDAHELETLCIGLGMVGRTHVVDSTDPADNNLDEMKSRLISTWKSWKEDVKRVDKDDSSVSTESQAPFIPKPKKQKVKK